MRPEQIAQQINEVSILLEHGVVKDHVGYSCSRSRTAMSCCGVALSHPIAHSLPNAGKMPSSTVSAIAAHREVLGEAATSTFSSDAPPAESFHLSRRPRSVLNMDPQLACEDDAVRLEHQDTNHRRGAACKRKDRVSQVVWRKRRLDAFNAWSGMNWARHRNSQGFVDMNPSRLLFTDEIGRVLLYLLWHVSRDWR